MTRLIITAVTLAFLADCQAFLPATPVPTPPTPPPGSTPPPLYDLDDPKIGVRYDFNVFVHCGLNGVYIDDELWLPVGGRVERRPGRFGGFNFDEGSIVLTDEDRATYTSSTGFEVELERWEGPMPSFDLCA